MEARYFFHARVIAALVERTKDRRWTTPGIHRDHDIGRGFRRAFECMSECRIDGCRGGRREDRGTREEGGNDCVDHVGGLLIRESSEI